MYQFFYNVLVPKFKDDIELLYMDTDAYVLNIYTDDVYKDLESMKEHFDFSDYPKDHFLYNVSNKKIICKFKDELNGKPLKEFVGIRSKCYSLKSQDSKHNKVKNKGINKKSLPTHADYKKCVFNNKELYKTNRNIISKDHNIYYQETNKIALNSFKRFICDKTHYHLRFITWGFIMIL